MKKNERLQALHLLTTLLQDQTPLSHLMARSNLSPLTKDICFGVCRHYFRLSAIADNLLSKRPKALEVWVSLLIGLYQLHYLRIPDYAVVKETVALLEHIKKSWAKGLVNAVLRTYCRKQQELIAALEQDHSFHYGHPEWFIRMLQQSWPKDWQAILQANDTHPPMSLRVNCKHTSVQDYLTRLQQIGMHAHPLNYASEGIDLEKPCDVRELPGFSEGDVSVQAEAAQLAVSLLDLKPSLRLLDVCAAPGGKTCHILEKEPNLAACIALDIDSKRIARVQENLSRLKLEATLIQGDATQPNTWWDGIPFDRILLDAPCSALGVIRRHPDIKLLRTPADIVTIAKVQHDLLKALWPLLAPGGLMVYATCSIIPEENEQQMAQFIAQQNDCAFVEKTQEWGHATGHGWQILPGEHNMDGFFYSVLQKKSKE
jgi:16S rRNA (cytosine967-C5)-methyltransferase